VTEKETAELALLTVRSLRFSLRPMKYVKIFSDTNCIKYACKSKSLLLKSDVHGVLYIYIYMYCVCVCVCVFVKANSCYSVVCMLAASICCSDE
jgi:hypothetical protein